MGECLIMVDSLIISHLCLTGTCTFYVILKYIVKINFVVKVCFDYNDHFKSMTIDVLRETYPSFIRKDIKMGRVLKHKSTRLPYQSSRMEWSMILVRESPLFPRVDIFAHKCQQCGLLKIIDKECGYCVVPTCRIIKWNVIQI